MSIEIKNLTKKYGKIKALDDVSLCLEENKIYGLLGRNGAGKSTLLNVVDGRIFADSGNIKIDGKTVNARDELCYENVFSVSADNLYPAHITVKEAVLQTARFHKSFDSQRCAELLKRFGISEKSKIGSLSTGYITAFKDVIGLCINKKYVFFDEPTLGMDAAFRELFYKSLIEQYSETGSTYVITTHLISEISSIIEKLVIISDGKIIVDGDCAAILNDCFCISGKTEVLEANINDSVIVSKEKIGEISAYYIVGASEAIKNVSGVEIKKLSLQDLFIKLTERG